MKQHKYVMLSMNGHSYEFDGIEFRLKQGKESPNNNALTRLLEEGWLPLRETKVDWHIHTWFRREHYQYVLILLEKEVPSSSEFISKHPRTNEL